jgi:hypothetical protein
VNSGRDRDGSVERLLERSLARDDSSSAVECPDSETLAAWVDGGLGTRDGALVEAHASDCARCQGLLAAIVQTAPEPPPSAWQENWRRGWGLRWLVPLAAAAAAGVILWVAVPNRRSDLPQQASAQLPGASPTPPQTETSRDRFSATAASTEQPAAANGTESGKTDDKAVSPGATDAEPRKEKAAAKDEAAAERLDTLDAQGRAGAAAADAAPPKTALKETVALSPLSRQVAKAASLEITSPDPSVRWRIGGTGSIEYTTNGGAIWETVPTGVSADLTAGASPSRLVCWLVGRIGIVLVSTDGRTWRRVSFPETTDLVAVQAADSQTATVTAADGRTFRTSDGGVTWTRT